MIVYLIPLELGILGIHFLTSRLWHGIIEVVLSGLLVAIASGFFKSYLTNVNRYFDRPKTDALN